jgi:hypothetical protein
MGLVSLALPVGNALAADAEAKAQLLRMAQNLANAETFSVSIRMGYDVVQTSGQKLQFGEKREILVARPNKVRVKAEQSDGDSGGLLFDGTQITLFSKSANVYSVTEKPGTLDAAIRYMVGELGMRVPLARLLQTTLAQDLEKLSSNVEYVEKNTLDMTPTDHLAGQLPDADYQIWVASDKLPRRIVLTYKNAPGQPQFWAEFSNWNLAPTVTDTTFVFSPPKDAEKIPTLIPARKQEAMNKTPGGA